MDEQAKAPVHELFFTGGLIGQPACRLFDGHGLVTVTGFRRCHENAAQEADK
jgi:hypothetical protein